MPLAFVILAHKNAHQVNRLFRAIYRPEHCIVLHFDRRAKEPLPTLGRELATAYPNVILLHPRTILWGGARMAAVQIEAMEVALSASPSWHHFINLTGQDFPIKPVEQLEAKLRENGEANYVSWFDPRVVPLWKNAEDRVLYRCLESTWLNRFLQVRGIGRVTRRLLGWQYDLPHVPFYRRAVPNFRYYGGSNHVILNRAACEYLTQDPRAHAIIEWLKHAAHANEIVYQSVLLNSPLASTIINTHLREIEFPPGAPNPKTFRAADFQRLITSRKFIARKFDESIDAEILNLLETHLKIDMAHCCSPAHLKAN